MTSGETLADPLAASMAAESLRSTYYDIPWLSVSVRHTWKTACDARSNLLFLNKVQYIVRIRT